MSIPSKPSIILIGTVHRDPRGFRKLRQALERQEPGVVTVEFSPYGRRFRQTQSPVWHSRLRENLRTLKRENGFIGNPMKHSAIQGIFFLLKDPYEWEAAATYAAERDIFLKEIDLSRYSRQKLAQVPELIDPANLRSLLRTPHIDVRPQVRAHYRRAKFFFLHPPGAWPTTEETQERERHMAKELRNLFLHGDGRKIIHIGGWEHLVEVPGTNSLFKRLRDLHPQRILLPEN